MIMNLPLDDSINPKLDSPFGMRFRKTGRKGKQVTYASPTVAFWDAWRDDRAEMEKKYSLFKQRQRWWVILLPT